MTQAIFDTLTAEMFNSCYDQQELTHFVNWVKQQADLDECEAICLAYTSVGGHPALKIIIEYIREPNMPGVTIPGIWQVDKVTDDPAVTHRITVVVKLNTDRPNPAKVWVAGLVGAVAGAGIALLARKFF